ncbi:hypothetical protein BpHYR1_033694 [Brachionus plicatilis]|uniref:Uncharacterized protein n=1 Tax=Brachionus plicatilis TaxID=10195 RepID=A0A3M7SKI0_BRAPC|nr:hypothetical protein BpHYR1_033694 [Brachionus plicatilis]
MHLTHFFSRYAATKNAAVNVKILKQILIVFTIVRHIIETSSRVLAVGISEADEASKLPLPVFEHSFDAESAAV